MSALTTTVYTPEPTYTPAFSAAPAFCVTVGGEETAVAAGPVPAALAAHARTRGARLWALLTAANPHSLALAPESNRQRHRELVRALTQAGIRFETAVTEARGVRSEAVIVWNVAPARAVGLARDFAQSAILYGDLEHARVVACEGLEFFI